MSGKNGLSDLIRASRNALVLRYILMASHLILLLTTFIVTLLATAITPLLVPQAVSLLLLFGYLPIALFLSIRPSSIALDAARVEVAYLAIQVALGMITMGIGISLLGGPSCHTAFTVDYLPKTLALCEIFIGVTLLNVSSAAISCTWMIWLLHLVNSNDFAGRRPWRMSVARMLRARSEDSAARVTLNEHGQIVDSGGMWQLVDPSSGGENGQWPEVHPQTPLLAQDQWDERDDARRSDETARGGDGGNDSDTETVSGRTLAPPPYARYDADRRRDNGRDSNATAPVDEVKSPQGF